jgi:hypothetical protein
MVATLDELKSPVSLIGTADDDRLRAISRRIQSTIVQPLRGAKDELEWMGLFPAKLEEWLLLRSQLAYEIRRALSGETIAAAGRSGLPPPVATIPEPARSAAVFAQALLQWLFGRVEGVTKNRRFDLSTLAELVRDLAATELALLTVMDDMKAPQQDVAEAAAWEAYARARTLRGLAFGLGLGDERIPTESAVEKAARARAMLSRVSSGWSQAERKAVEDARLSRAETRS